jgi:hypothetical protein
VRGVSITTILKGKKDLYILTYVYKLRADGNFSDECRTAPKTNTVEDYSQYVGFIDKESG